MNYSKVCETARTIVQKTAIFIEGEQKNPKDLGTESKGEHNFVTMVDKEAEKMLVNGLSTLIPESGFIAEEGTSDKKGDRYNWIIDPVDGTTNFIHGMAPYAISVALMDYDDIVVGIVYEIGAHECFYAWKGSPAYLNGEIIKVSDAPRVSDCLVATGFPYTNFKYLDGFMKSVRYFMENSQN